MNTSGEAADQVVRMSLEVGEAALKISGTGMLNITSVPMLVVIVAAGLVGGLIGGFIGQKALKKHFIKAGLVSVK